jgi:histidyl-tRNA synthetase
MRRADKFRSRFTLIIGEDELKKGNAVLKDMDQGTQEEIPIDAKEIAGRVKAPETA